MGKFRKWYRQDRKAKHFTYYTDWTGFNVPGHVVDVFRDAKNKTPAEKELFKHLPHTREPRQGEMPVYYNTTEHKIDVMGKYYVIASHGSSRTTVRHEVGHSLYYMYPAYRDMVNEVLDKAEAAPGGKRAFRAVRRLLRETGYANKTIKDETHAFIMADRDYLEEEGVWDAGLDQVTHDLNTIFDSFMAALGGKL
jgi:hypothetical protein